MCDSNTSRVCGKCGQSDWRKSGECGPCARIREANKYAKNPEKYKAKHARWYAKNVEKKSEIAKTYRQKNLERVRAKERQYRTENPEKRRESGRRWDQENQDIRKIHKVNRRLRESCKGQKLSTGLENRLFELQGGKCPCCGQPLGSDFHLDHIMPLALGGSNTDDNIQLLRATCNSSKHAKHPVEYMQSKGFLL